MLSQPPSWTSWTVLIWSTGWSNLHTGCPTLLTLSSIIQNQTSLPKWMWTGSSLTTILYSLTLPHPALLPPQKCNHTESTKTSTPMSLWRMSGNLLSNLLDHLYMTRQTTTTQHFRQYRTTMHLSKVKNAQVMPKSPGLTVTSLKPSDIEGILRRTGTRTSQT